MTPSHDITSHTHDNVERIFVAILINYTRHERELSTAARLATTRALYPSLRRRTSSLFLSQLLRESKYMADYSIALYVYCQMYVARARVCVVLTPY